MKYSQYWNSLLPETEKEVLERIAFAILSVHTAWTANIRQYRNIQSVDWIEKPIYILEALKQGGGMFHQKTKALRELLVNRKHYLPQPKEDWFQFRNKLLNIPHLGLAKSSFAAELCCPTTTALHPVCLDTHVLGWCGYKSRNGKLKPEEYKTIEKSFDNICDDRPTFIIRNILWDKVQNKNSARYWAHVLEQ